MKAGYQVDLFSEDSFSGNKVTFTADSACLNDIDFSDKTSSLMVYRSRTDTISGLYNLINKESGLYLDSEDGIAYKDYLIQTGFTGSPIQQFTIKDLENGFYHTLASSGRAIHISVVKGIRNFNVEKAFELSLNSVERFGNGSRGYAYEPFVVSNTLEYAYFDRCVSQFARAYGKDKEAKIFGEKSMAYSEMDPFDLFKGLSQFSRRLSWK